MKCDICDWFKLKTYAVLGKRVCEKCLAKKGFTPEDIESSRYNWMSWDMISQGKDKVDEYLDEKDRTKVIKINLGDVDDPRIDKFLNSLKNNIDKEDLYGGMSLADLKEYYDEEPHHIYGGIDFDCEVKREGDRIGVYHKGFKVADTDYIEELDKYDCETYLIINGGKYRQIDIEEDYGTKYTNVSGEDPYWLMLKIVYILPK